MFKSLAVARPLLRLGRRELSSINTEEVARFNGLAQEWWRVPGPYGMLHAMTSQRISFISRAVRSHLNTKTPTTRILSGLNILDIGSGGGILSEPMTRLGASVLGIDASAETVKVAQHHARQDSSLAGRLEYECTTAEDVALTGKAYDVVVASEIIEHIDNQSSFLASCCSLVKVSCELQPTTSWPKHH